MYTFTIKMEATLTNRWDTAPSMSRAENPEPPGSSPSPCAKVRPRAKQVILDLQETHGRTFDGNSTYCGWASEIRITS
jgi:hypothetical protein